MPRFYFHVEKAGSRVSVDGDGAVLPDVEAAWYHAYRSFAAFGEPGQGAERATLEVEDETGMPVFALSIGDLPLASA